MFNDDNLKKLWPNKEWKVKQQKNPENLTKQEAPLPLSQKNLKKKNKIAEV